MAKPRMVPLLEFWRVAVEMEIEGRLYATSPSSEEGVDHMLAAVPASQAQMAAREAAGEPVLSLEELRQQIVAETVGVVDAAAERPGLAVWHRDDTGAFIHPNYFKGHFRACGDALGKTLDFWGLQSFITKTLFVRPPRVRFAQDATIGVEEWPMHFDVYRKGRLAGIRQAEYVDSPCLQFRLYLLQDPAWSDGLLRNLLDYGSLHGIGGGRGRGLSLYNYRLGEWIKATRDETWNDRE